LQSSNQLCRIGWRADDVAGLARRAGRVGRELAAESELGETRSASLRGARSLNGAARYQVAQLVGFGVVKASTNGSIPLSSTRET